MTGIVYVLTNEMMPGLVKIGATEDDLAARIRGLFTTGVPLPFELFYACEVRDCWYVERQMHDAFGDHRISKSRESFRIAPERVKAALSIGAIREIRLGDEIFENLPDTGGASESEVKAEVETAKRREKFQFAMIGMRPGTELQLEKDRTIICVTVDEKNKVQYLGDVTSLSDAAMQAIRSKGYEWSTVSGPWEWTYQGRRLDDIRREIEEKSD